jgi:hypothetical protein
LSKNPNHSLLDPGQIKVKTFNEENDSVRVTIIEGGDFIRIPEAIVERKVQIEKIEVPVIIKELEIKEISKDVIVQKVIFEKIPEIIREVQIEKIEVPIVITEYEKINIPVPIKELEIKEIIREVPIVQTKIERIEVPVIVKELEFVEMSNWIKLLIVSQLIVSIINMIIHK